MKTTKLTPLHRKPRSLAVACSALCLLQGLGTETSHAVAVDTELLLLVDVSGSMSNRDFRDLTDGLANSFRSSEVLQSIQSGAQGSIAASVIFWSGNNRQRIGIDWVNISDSVSAEAFAVSLENARRPFRGGTALADAIRDNSDFFGDETGGTANNFESSAQIINVIGNGIDNASRPRRDRPGQVAAASSEAIANGVDTINAVAVLDDDPNLATYFDQYVVAGNGGNTISSSDYSAVQSIFTPQLATSLNEANVSVVPEPSVSLFAIAATGLMLFQRKRS